jgi:hypothetical protein
MVCIPCFLIPIFLFIWHRFIQPIVLAFWNPWKVEDKKDDAVKAPGNKEEEQLITTSSPDTDNLQTQTEKPKKE